MPTVFRISVENVLLQGMCELLLQAESNPIFYIKNQRAMKDSRRSFLKLTGVVGMGMVTNPLLKAGPLDPSGDPLSDIAPSSTVDNDGGQNLIGHYGPWASGLHKNELPLHSDRKRVV